MRITPQEAAPYFWHRNCALHGEIPEWAFCHAAGGVCGAFHWAPWPGWLQVHVGVMPQVRGRADEAALRLLHEAWEEHEPERIAALFKESNRPVAALCRRLGFQDDGRLPMREPVIIMGWAPCLSV